MGKNRVEAFTDGVIAIIITIMVLELAPPAGGTFAALAGLRDKFLIYIVSFFTLAIYWNNHHHLFQITKRIDGIVLWVNILFLFALSLFPFATAWVGDEHFGSFAPEMFYGMIVLLADVTYYLLTWALIHANGTNSAVHAVLGRGYYKPVITILGNVVAILLALVWPPLTIIIDALLLLLWLVPERRIERHLNDPTKPKRL